MSDPQIFKVAILVVSDTASQDASTDRVLPALKECFTNATSVLWEVQLTEIVPDDILQIATFVKRWSDEADAVNLIVTSGGTGFAVKDHTPEVSWSVDRSIEHGSRCGRLTQLGRIAIVPSTCVWSGVSC